MGAGREDRRLNCQRDRDPDDRLSEADSGELGGRQLGQRRDEHDDRCDQGGLLSDLAPVEPTEADERSGHHEPDGPRLVLGERSDGQPESGADHRAEHRPTGVPERRLDRAVHRHDRGNGREPRVRQVQQLREPCGESRCEPDLQAPLRYAPVCRGHRRIIPPNPPPPRSDDKSRSW